MREYNESEALGLSGIQHFAFCRRQWALIHIEGVWEENLRTAERPRRCSLSLDLVEEFRAPFVDRFVLTLINKRLLDENSFVVKENGAVMLTDEGRRVFLTQWQKKKQEEIRHPFLQEKMQWGLLPSVQAMLLAKYIRGDLDDYPPFIWK